MGARPKGVVDQRGVPLDGVGATAPDPICVLDTDTGDPVATEGLRVGVLVATCDPRWTTPGGLALAGPRYFGYDVDHLPFLQG
ncbi:hypothetical protein ACH4CE_19655 [Streptomyces gelaticus]|uniref:S-methyl thiohydantoin desulfurase domain-containing protein n=1 Tax=Streptomyces gelaticus TaxID=285446 RepID=UPI0037B2A830